MPTDAEVKEMEARRAAAQTANAARFRPGNKDHGLMPSGPDGGGAKQNVADPSSTAHERIMTEVNAAKTQMTAAAALLPRVHELEEAVKKLTARLDAVEKKA